MPWTTSFVTNLLGRRARVTAPDADWRTFFGEYEGQVGEIVLVKGATAAVGGSDVRVGLALDAGPIIGLDLHHLTLLPLGT